MKRTVESLTPPENKQVMWLDVSGKVKQLKTYINGEWVIVNDDTENNEGIVKEILGKIDKDFESYIKKEDADSKYVQQEVLDRDYVKSEYATKTYATIKELNNLSTSLDSDYVKKTYADSNYVIKNTLDGYITKSYADNTYATKSTLEDYVTITDADTKYVSTETLNSYITADAISEAYATKDAIKDFITTTTAESTYAKITSLSDYIKSVDVENNYVSKTDTSYVKTDTLDNYVTIETANSTFATQTALAGKVDKEEGKGLSTNDFTNDFKTKLEGIAEGATNVIVDDTIKESNNAIQNRAVKEALDSKANNSVFTESANGLVPKANTTAEKTTAVLTAEGKWMPSYDASKTRIKGTFLATPTDADGKADFRAIAAKDLPEDIVLDLLSYGVYWKPNVGDPVLTRVGNMTYHKTLPIQNNMRGCIAQMKDGAKIIYYLDPTDWRWRKDTRGYIINTELKIVGTTDREYTITNEIFNNFQYKDQWVKIQNMPCQVIGIDTSTNTATLKSTAPGLEPGFQDVELGAVLNGYDGEVMVEVPEFWIKSWDTDTRREVRISPTYIDSTWEHQPRILISPYCDTILNTVPSDMGYLSTLEIGSAISVVNTDTYCRGGSNNPNYDEYITTNPFRSMLGKPNLFNGRKNARVACRKSGKEVLNYLQYKRILYWLYVIEYANFKCRETFNAKLTSEGFRQGGVGEGIIAEYNDIDDAYKGDATFTPNGYTNGFGNGTNIQKIEIIYKSVTTTMYAIRWHGIENPFGDTGFLVDGIIIIDPNYGNYEQHNIDVYVTDNPSLYSDSEYSKMKKIGVVPYGKIDYIKEWDLGNTAEIIPRLLGGNVTQYRCGYYVYFMREVGFLVFGYLGEASWGGLGDSYFVINEDSTPTYCRIHSVCVMP